MSIHRSVVGLLVDRRGFPLEIGRFEGNRAETMTILPIIKQFQERHTLADMVVVADAGMLSAGNLKELDGAGLRFIVGSRVTRARAVVVGEASLARAHRLVGWKGHVTNIPVTVMGAREVIESYHDLWRVEQSIRMSKTDLRARPMFHHTREAQTILHALDIDPDSMDD